MQKIVNNKNINRIRKKYDVMDQKIVSTMDKYGVDLLRIAMGIVFIWFGSYLPKPHLFAFFEEIQST